jgi:hypothetical protein
MAVIKLKPAVILILIGLCSFVLGVISTNLYQQKHNEITILNIAQILSKKASEYAEIQNQDSREEKINAINAQNLRKLMAKLNMHLVIDQQCLINNSKKLKVKDRTAELYKALP